MNNFLAIHFQDAIVSDDFMGEAQLHLDTFSPDDSYRVDLELEDGGDPLLIKKKKKKSLGSIEIEFSFDLISQSQFNQVSYDKVSIGGGSCCFMSADGGGHR